MNLPTDPNQSPSVDELPPPTAPEVAARQAELAPVKAKQPPFKVIGIVAASLIGVGLLAAFGNSDNHKHDDNDSTSVSSGAGTGNASTDNQIVDAIWESSGKASLCPSFNELKATMTSLTEDEIIDMGMAAAGPMDGVTPAQLARLRELVKSDC